MSKDGWLPDNVTWAQLDEAFWDRDEEEDEEDDEESDTDAVRD